MAENVTEAEERIIQLLAALNSTLGSYTASQESDTSDKLANQLSSTALVVSLVALVVALLQAVLDYVSSNSAQGDKCDTSAIGGYARISRTRWSWRRWRRKYFYPQLELDPNNVCFGLHSLESSEVGKIFEGLENLVTPSLENYEKIGQRNAMRKEYYSWRYHPELDSFWPKYFIRNGRNYLFRRIYTARLGPTWVMATPLDLPIKYKIKWIYYCISHGFANDSTPRATWAQLLTLLSVDPMRMKWRGPIPVDANSIPSCLDVPALKVKLTDLGCFAFCLGFRQVDINTTARKISATGETGTITTESMPGFGDVVVLQVSSPRPQHLVVQYRELEVRFHRGQLLGSFIFYGIPGDEKVHYRSIRRNFTKSGAYADARCPTVADEVKWWVEITKGCNHKHSEASDTDLCLECLAIWQPAAGGRSWPSILLAASAASIPRVTTGFPSSVFLDPFLRVFQSLAHSLSATRGAIWSQYNLKKLKEGTMVLELLQYDLCRVTGHEYLSWGSSLEGACGHLSWMRNACRPHHIDLIENVLLSRMCTYPPWTRVSSTEFKGLSVVPFLLFQKDQTSSTEDPVTSDSANAESLTEGHLMPYIIDLFNDFNPGPWSAALRGQSSPKYDGRQRNATGEDAGGWRNNLQPHNVLWTQSFLLDLAITKTCHQHTTSMEAVAGALVESWEEPWEPTSQMTAPLENLHQFLYRNAFKDQTSGEIPEEARRLADMIKARMLCYIAYMMVIPDSTSLYEASLKDPVVLPMI